jgi:hypothetical protein
MFRQQSSLPMLTKLAMLQQPSLAERLVGEGTPGADRETERRQKISMK